MRPLIRKGRAERIKDAVVAGLWFPLALVHFQRFLNSGSILSLGLALETGLLAFLFVIRDVEQARGSLWEWAVAAFAVIFPLAAFESLGRRHLLAEAVELAALIGILLALFSLGRSFGAAPANRGIRTGGLYRWIRHPLYSFELLFLIGYVLGNLTPRNLIVLVVMAIVQWFRSVREERLLEQTPIYRDYKSRVRWRFLPGVF